MAQLVSVQLYVYTAPAKQAGGYDYKDANGYTYTYKNKKATKQETCSFLKSASEISAVAALGTAATGAGAPFAVALGAFAAVTGAISTATC